MSDTNSNIIQRVSDKLQYYLHSSKAERIVAAYSGGLDSTVLLHLLKTLSKALHFEILAVHINHQLHSDADDWAVHCHNQAEQLGITCKVITVQVSSAHRQGLEAAAREARYQALQSVMTTSDLLLTAHHSNDQAETVLLRLLRGTGITGIKAIADYQTLDKGTLARPMLSIARTDIRCYAQENQLNWLEDPSNEDTQPARNYLRHRISPIIDARWPMWHETVSRYARHQAEAEAVIDIEAKRYLQRCLLLGSPKLLLRAFITLSAPHQHLVLRAWCKLNGIAIPNAHQLMRICDAIGVHIYTHNGTGSGIISTCSDTLIGVYHGTLHAIKPQTSILNLPITWHSNSDCEIPQLNLKLRRTELMRQAPSLYNKELDVSFRRGGERCACRNQSGELFHKSLKKVFQEHHIPAWQRDKTPLIYAQGRLRLIWNIAECA